MDALPFELGWQKCSREASAGHYDARRRLAGRIPFLWLTKRHHSEVAFHLNTKYQK